MDNLTSSDVELRNQAIDNLENEATDNPDSLSNKIQTLLSILPKIEDPLIALRVSAVFRDSISNLPNYSEHYDAVMSVIQEFLGMDITEENYRESVILNLLGSLQSKLQTDTQFATEHLSTLFSLMKVGGNLKFSGSGPITVLAMQKPELLKDHVSDLFEVIQDGNDTLLNVIQQLYGYDKESFASHFDFILRLYYQGMTGKIQALNLMRVMAPDYPELFPNEVFADAVKELGNPSVGSLVIALFYDVAERMPEKLAPFHQQIYEESKKNTSLLHQSQNILSLIGRAHSDLRATIFSNLMDLLNYGNNLQKSMTLQEIRNLVETDRELLTPYLDTIRGLENHAEESVRDQAKAIIDFYEGRDIRSLANRIEEQNALIAESASSVEELMAYVDDNISMVKDFIAEITKKLPIPKSFDTQGRIRKTIILNFVCDDERDRCLFPTDRPFTVESKSWSKWLKIAFSGIKLGKSLILPFSMGDAGKAVKEAYSAYKEKGDEDFLKYISQPFLLSSEQDALIEQLREARYFDIFHYDPQQAAWKCTMCNL